MKKKFALQRIYWNRQMLFVTDFEITGVLITMYPVNKVIGNSREHIDKETQLNTSNECTSITNSLLQEPSREAACFITYFQSFTTL